MCNPGWAGAESCCGFEDDRKIERAPEGAP
jgi:hypothetical protein